jgi:hypothetical protein
LSCNYKNEILIITPSDPAVKLLLLKIFSVTKTEKNMTNDKNDQAKYT